MEKGLNAVLRGYKNPFDEIRSTAMHIIHAADEIEERMKCLQKFTDGFSHEWSAIGEKFSETKPEMKCDENLGTDDSMKENERIRHNLDAMRRGNNGR